MKEAEFEKLLEVVNSIEKLKKNLFDEVEEDINKLDALRRRLNKEGWLYRQVNELYESSTRLYGASRAPLALYRFDEEAYKSLCVSILRIKALCETKSEYLNAKSERLYKDKVRSDLLVAGSVLEVSHDEEEIIRNKTAMQAYEAELKDEFSGMSADVMSSLIEEFLNEKYKLFRQIAKDRHEEDMQNVGFLEWKTAFVKVDR